MTRTEFTAHVQAMINAIAKPVISGDQALNTLRNDFGMKPHALGFNPFFEDHTWEHPEITRHNQGCRGRELSLGFFTLYSKISDYEKSSYKFCGEMHTTPAHSKGYIQFIIGRVGNTFSVEKEVDITEDAPVASVESQGSLFAEVSRG